MDSKFWTHGTRNTEEHGGHTHTRTVVLDDLIGETILELEIPSTEHKNI